VKVTFAPLVAVLIASLFWVGHADAQVRARGYYRPYYYRPYFYSSYFYRPFYWYPYAAVGYGYGYGRFDGDGSLRMQVMPRDTEVYIDNYYAGTVDDFDGMFQRLHVEPGSHDITLYREGYRTVRQRIYIQPTGTFRLRYNMVPLGPGEIPEPRPAEPATSGPIGPGLPPQGAPSQAGPNQYPPPYPPQPPRGAYPPQGAYPPPPQRGGAPYPPAPPAQGGAASLAIRVQPVGADVFIDGERWDSSGDDRLVVQVAPGVHHIEVRRDGYRTYATDITARPGETSTVNISLTRQ